MSKPKAISLPESIASLAVRRPVAVTVLAIAVALVGYLAWERLPVDLLPDLQSPTVAVSVTSGDRPPTEMERLYGEQLDRKSTLLNSSHSSVSRMPSSA